MSLASDCHDQGGIGQCMWWISLTRDVELSLVLEDHSDDFAFKGGKAIASPEAVVL